MSEPGGSKEMKSMMGRIRGMGVAVLVGGILAGCGGGGSPTQGGEGETSMSATIQGSAWNASSFLSFANYSTSANLLLLYGLNTASYSIAINLGGVSTTGTYNLVSAGSQLRFASVSLPSDSGWGTPYESGGGTVTITSFSDTRITGSFQFTAFPTPSSQEVVELTVINGEFDLPVNLL
jgi:hypothetical protein